MSNNAKCEQAVPLFITINLFSDIKVDCFYVKKHICFFKEVGDLNQKKDSDFQFKLQLLSKILIICFLNYFQLLFKKSKKKI